MVIYQGLLTDSGRVTLSFVITVSLTAIITGESSARHKNHTDKGQRKKTLHKNSVLFLAPDVSAIEVEL
jgi:hypothetical protein